MKNNFVAIDFETSYGHIPCSIGIVEFIDGIVANEYYSLIKPIELKFNPINSNINGIYLEDVFNEREFDEIWPEIEHFFIDRIVVAHNSSTDIAVLEKTLSYYNIHKPYYDSYCTLSMAKRVIDIENYKLSTLANYFKIIQEDYHNALEDAYICGRIFYYLIDYSNINMIKEELNIKKIKEIKSKITFNNIEIKYNKSSKLNGKAIVISGVFETVSREELKQIIENNGGKVGSSISSKTNYVVAGENMGPSKRTKAEQLKIPILTEMEFLQMINK